MPLSLSPLGDNAILIDYGNVIDEDINKTVLARFHQLLRDPLPGMTEAVPAYGSLTVFYDLFALRNKAVNGSVYDWMKQRVEEWLLTKVPDANSDQRVINIPVCYQGKDLNPVKEATGLSEEEIIGIHTSASYRVYMLGFLPGFAYMGRLDPRLFTKRKIQPETVEAGSVAITGNQTGIYPLVSPGGWSVIGKTPLKLFDAGSDNPVLLAAGDLVRFYSITKEEFNSFPGYEHNDR